jgi:hypothetical protein
VVSSQQQHQQHHHQRWLPSHINKYPRPPPSSSVLQLARLWPRHSTRPHPTIRPVQCTQCSLLGLSPSTVSISAGPHDYPHGPSPLRCQASVCLCHIQGRPNDNSVHWTQHTGTRRLLCRAGAVRRWKLLIGGRGLGACGFSPLFADAGPLTAAAPRESRKGP